MSKLDLDPYGEGKLTPSRHGNLEYSDEFESAGKRSMCCGPVTEVTDE